MDLTIVSGLSGSGKTVTLQALEDIGYYCIDNLPANLLPHFAASLIVTYLYTNNILTLLNSNVHAYRLTNKNVTDIYYHTWREFMNQMQHFLLTK